MQFSFLDHSCLDLQQQPKMDLRAAEHRQHKLERSLDTAWNYAPSGNSVKQNVKASRDLWAHLVQSLALEVGLHK